LLYSGREFLDLHIGVLAVLHGPPQAVLDVVLEGS
jgi:hypothetical protein